MSTRRCASSWRWDPQAPAHASTTFAYDAKLWKGIDLLRIHGTLVSQIAAVVNKTDLALFCNCRTLQASATLLMRAQSTADACRVTCALCLQAGCLYERETQHGRHRLAASLGSFCCSHQKRGKQICWILMPSPLFERSWAARVARWKKKQPCVISVVWQWLKWPALAHVAHSNCFLPWHSFYF